MKLPDLIVSVYRYLFARRLFHGFNSVLYHCSLRGLGILNYESNRHSGETRFLANWLKDKPHCTVIDVGANTGTYSMQVLAACPTAIVHAFEPHPKTFQELTTNIQCHNFYPHNCAVSAEVGTVSLYDHADREGSSHASLYKDVIERIHNSRSIEYRAEVITLQSFLQSNSIDSIELLKIDVEGNELNVLKGALEYVRDGRIKAIHFEFNEMNVIARTYFRDFWELLPNYAFFRLLPDGIVPIEQYTPVTCEIFAYQNIVAFRR